MIKTESDKYLINIDKISSRPDMLRKIEIGSVIIDRMVLIDEPISKIDHQCSFITSMQSLE